MTTGARFIQSLSPLTHWPRYRILLTLLVLSRGVVLLCVMPPLEGWDEYQHVAYIVHIIETGRDPVFGEARAPASLLRVVSQFPHGASAIEQIGGHGARSPADFWAGRSTEAVSAAGAPLPLYQAQHASLYYRVVAPLFSAVGGLGDLSTSVGVLRLANVLLISAAVWIILGRLGTWCRDRRHAALLGLLIALQPLFVINAARVASDALAVFLATIVVVWTIELNERRFAPRCLAIGLVAGLAVLAKVVNLALLPFVGGCIVLLIARRRVRLPVAATGLLLFSAGSALVTQHYFRFNLAHFGMLTPMQEAIANRSQGRDADALLDAAGLVSWGRLLRNIWLKRWLWAGGWSFVSSPHLFRDACEVTCDLALLGWLFMLSRTTRVKRRMFAVPLVPLRAGWLCVCFTAALGWHAVQSQAAWGTVSTNVWYAAAAFPWWLVVLYAGAMAWPGGRWKFVIPLHLGWLFVLTEMFGVYHAMVRTYACVPLGREALRRLASLQPGWLGTPTLAAAALLGAILVAAAVIGWIAAMRESPRAVEPARDSDPPIRR